MSADPERVRRAAESHWWHEVKCRECGPLTDEDYAYMAATLDASGYPDDLSEEKRLRAIDQADLERALDALAFLFAGIAIECDDERLGYVTAQIERDSLESARAVLADLTNVGQLAHGFYECPNYNCHSVGLRVSVQRAPVGGQRCVDCGCTLVPTAETGETT